MNILNHITNYDLQSECPHCDKNSFAYKHPLEEKDDFCVICDVHPIVEGHLLIIPRRHISCIGAFDDDTFKAFLKLYEKCVRFLSDVYGGVSAFEHGIVGQTVFHAHMHLVPRTFAPEVIIPEGMAFLISMPDLSELRAIFANQRQYLFFSSDDRMWYVNPSLAQPRFFRDRFAAACGNPCRGNWKEMRTNATLMELAEREIMRCKQLWAKHSLSEK